ncbi:MAG TPA: VTT domain-containing protein [Ferruginibacter sp.]|nr:VTT domain-containing protein [Ferruginibacter sp.]
MVDNLLELFREHPDLAVLISIAVSIIIALLGLIPSVFITAANILFFGFWKGTLISFLGEAFGAAIAFYLYRMGFKKPVEKKLDQYPKIKRLVDATGSEAFGLIFSLRLIPFVPSGLITFAAGVGKVSAPVFIAASSLGKLPALLIEAYAVYEVTAFGWQGKLILAVAALALLYWIIKRKK